MKKLILSISMILIALVSMSQVDTVITMPNYTSYYSFKLKNPLMVVYPLYKGGGSCKRTEYHFKKDSILGHRIAVPSDYAKSGYDEGHLANAEDFAFNCRYDSLTFNFWNCCPQTPQLNRGIWKIMETNVRNISQTDSLLILCGSIYGNNEIGNGVYVPLTCWKVVYSYKQKKVILSNIFTNTNVPTMSIIDYNDLNTMLKKTYNIDLNVVLKK